MILLGYDLGTSSVKACLMDAATGKVLATDFYPHQEAPIKSLQPGWAEQAPEDWWARVVEATRSVMAMAKINPEDIKAIGISYQMHGLVMVDKAENTTETAPIISSFPERLELDGNRTPVIGNASTPRPTAAGMEMNIVRRMVSRILSFASSRSPVA